jgi:hypothetical protein
MMQTYGPEIEHAMKKYYSALSEKDTRRYVARVALTLGMAAKLHSQVADVQRKDRKQRSD